jgi:hypothetical protein
VYDLRLSTDIYEYRVVAEEPKQVTFDASLSTTIALTFDSTLLSLTHPNPPVKQLYSPFRIETDFLHQCTNLIEGPVNLIEPTLVSD